MELQNKLEKYDYVLIGCGLYSITFANKMKEHGKTCLIIDKRPHIGGNCYTENKEGINIHTYGPHIVHTSSKEVWDHLNKYATFNHFVNRPKVNYKGNIYSFPINLMTMYQLYGTKTPEEAKRKLEEVKIPCQNPRNLEEWILSQVGPEIYETFIKGYTTKQWNHHPSELPSSIIKRLPIRMNFDDNYFNDTYQGIPIGGYTAMLENMLEGIEVRTNIDYFANKEYWDSLAKKVVFTGKIDEFFDYQFGDLEYRSLRFEVEKHDVEDYQGNAVINYTEESVPYTRITEHKNFEFGTQKYTYITKEYPDDYDRSKVPFYPVRDEKNMKIYEQYKKLSEQPEYSKYLFGGRLGSYLYYDIHQIIPAAWTAVKKELNG